MPYFDNFRLFLVLRIYDFIGLHVQYAQNHLDLSYLHSFFNPKISNPKSEMSVNSFPICVFNVIVITR